MWQEEHKERLWGGQPLLRCLRCGKVRKSLPWDPAVHKSPDGALHTDLKVRYLEVGTSMASEEIMLLFL